MNFQHLVPLAVFIYVHVAVVLHSGCARTDTKEKENIIGRPCMCIGVA